MYNYAQSNTQLPYTESIASTLYIVYCRLPMVTITLTRFFNLEIAALALGLTSLGGCYFPEGHSLREPKNVIQSYCNWPIFMKLRNRKHASCFYWVIPVDTWVEVWENEKCCGNTSRRRVFPQLFRVVWLFLVAYWHGAGLISFGRFTTLRGVVTLNTERSYITRLRCSACQSQIPMEGQCSHLIGLFTQV